MDTFRPRRPPQNEKDLPSYVEQEFAAVQQAANRGSSALRLVVLYAEPAKLEAGMLVYASGAGGWDPGSGEGVYRYSLAGSWVFLG